MSGFRQNHFLNLSESPLRPEIEKASTVCECEDMGAEDKLFLLYTSGSTGKPKGIVHTTGGYMLFAQMTVRHVFDVREGDVFGCVADIGWITGKRLEKLRTRLVNRIFMQISR